MQLGKRCIPNILGTYGRGDVECGEWELRKGEGRSAVRASCSDETELQKTAVSLENQVTGMKWWNINVSYSPINHIYTFSIMKKWKCVWRNKGCNFCLQGVIATVFIKANLYWCRYRKFSRLGQYPVTEVLVVAVITAVIAYPNPYTRMNTSQLILLLFSQCGVSNSDNLW